MNEINSSTKCAPAERARREELERQISHFQKSDIMTELLGKIPTKKNLFCEFVPFDRTIGT